MEKVLIIDFGSQTVQLIAKTVRKSGVYCEIMPHFAPFEKIEQYAPNAIIFSGGNCSCYEKNSPTIDKKVFEMGVPILGICYGMQLMSKLLGVGVSQAKVSEFGKAQIEVDSSSLLFDGVDKKFFCWMSHFDAVEQLPDGFERIAKTENCLNAAMENKKSKLYGVQFHPEVNNCQFGNQILDNFLHKICLLGKDWSLDDFIEKTVEDIKRQVGDSKVICAFSGGVDSAVAATLVHKAIGDKLTCIFIDQGLMRKDEAKQVLRVFKEERGLNLLAFDKEEHFLSKLRGVSEPEKKRKIIGEEFIRVFEQEAVALGGADYLVQGTIYPDIIESGSSSNGEVIKTHHNVGGLPKVMNFKGLIEPVKNLFKDEVREVGIALGLPKHIVMRQPFPGPGLAVRCLGEVSKDKLDIIREADFIFRDEIAKAGLDGEIWQYFALLPPVRSTGVMGDKRTYEYTVALRAVTSVDAMTANWARIPFDVLERASSRITNSVKGVNRVVYDITAKPPSTIEWE